MIIKFNDQSKKKKKKKKVEIHILPNISRSKDNQARKVGQLRRYNMGNVFLQKLHRK